MIKNVVVTPSFTNHWKIHEVITTLLLHHFNVITTWSFTLVTIDHGATRLQVPSPWHPSTGAAGGIQGEALPGGALRVWLVHNCCNGEAYGWLVVGDGL